MGMIVQDAYYMTDDVISGIATGLYKRYGSVVRYATGPSRGQIVTHLKSCSPKNAANQMNLGHKAVNFVLHHKKETIFVSAGLLAAGATAAGYKVLKNRESKALRNFREKLRIYIDAIRKGDMTIETIEELYQAAEELKSQKNYEKICIQLTAEEFDVLVGRIYDYTLKLASDNEVELCADDLETKDGVIVNLQTYLKAQKMVFEQAS